MLVSTALRKNNFKAADDAGLVHSSKKGKKPASDDLKKILDVYTFSLSVRLPEGARVKDLTHEEALRILEELPFRISCCTQPVAAEAPQAPGAVPDTDGPVVLDDATKLALLDWQIEA